MNKPIPGAKALSFQRPAVDKKPFDITPTPPTIGRNWLGECVNPFAGC